MPPILITPENYYLSVWYCEWCEGNLLACAWRNPLGVYEGAFRFRYQFTNKMSWYTIEIPNKSDTDITDAFDSLFRFCSLKHFCDVIETPINGYGEKAWGVFKSLPFTNVSDKEGIDSVLN